MCPIRLKIFDCFIQNSRERKRVGVSKYITNSQEVEVKNEKVGSKFLFTFTYLHT